MQGTTLHVGGTLNVGGTADSPVTILPVTGAPNWAGIAVDSGGTISMSNAMGTDVATLVYCHNGATCDLDHVDFSSMGNAIVAEGKATISASRITDVANGGVTVRTGGDLTITDSYVQNSQGDIIVVSGGKLDIEYSDVGHAQGSYDHCDFHINSADSLTISHVNIADGVYGMMLAGTTNAVIQYNNFTGNGTGNDIDLIGANSGADLQYNYWDQGAPALGAGYNTANAAGAMLTDAGPRAGA